MACYGSLHCIAEDNEEITEVAVVCAARNENLLVRSLCSEAFAKLCMLTSQGADPEGTVGERGLDWGTMFEELKVLRPRRRGPRRQKRHSEMK